MKKGVNSLEIWKAASVPSEPGLICSVPGAAETASATGAEPWHGSMYLLLSRWGTWRGVFTLPYFLVFRGKSCEGGEEKKKSSLPTPDKPRSTSKITPTPHPRRMNPWQVLPVLTPLHPLLGLLRNVVPGEFQWTILFCVGTGWTPELAVPGPCLLPPALNTSHPIGPLWPVVGDRLRKFGPLSSSC